LAFGRVRVASATPEVSVVAVPFVNALLLWIWPQSSRCCCGGAAPSKKSARGRT